MRRLAVSLVCSVLAASVGAGWLIDRVFERIEQQPPGAIDAWRRLGAVTAELSSRVDEPAATLERLSRQSELELDWLPGDALGGGEGDGATVSSALDSPLGLALQSDEGIDVYYRVPERDALLAISWPNHDTLAPMWRMLLTLSFYSALFALMLLWLRPVLRRLQRLDRAAIAFGQGRLDHRVPAGGGGEIAHLEASFNHMASRIESLIEDNRLLSSAVSHDLRTPMSRLRFGIDALAELDGSAISTRGNPIEAARQRYLARLESDIATMERLVETLLEYTRLDARLRQADTTPGLDDRLEAIDAAKLVRRCIADFDRGGHELELQLAADLPLVHWHESHLGMLLSNLLQNARRFARGRMLVRLQLVDRALDLSVEDDGPGIALDERTRLRQPFQRGTSEASQRPESQPLDDHHGASELSTAARSPSRSQGDAEAGYGLGLAIVERIAHWHHATMEIGSSERLGGASIRVRFPLQ